MRKPKCQFLGVSKEFQNYGITVEYNFPPEKEAPADKNVRADCRSIRGTSVGGHVLGIQMNFYYSRIPKDELLSIGAHEVLHATEKLDSWLHAHGAYRKGADRSEARASFVQLFVWVFEQYVRIGLSENPFMKKRNQKVRTPVNVEQYLKDRASKMKPAEQVNRCPYHPKYKGLREPTSECVCCEGIYERLNAGGGNQ